MVNLDNCKDREWLEAQAQLWAAQRLPAGGKRTEALKRLLKEDENLVGANVRR